MEKRGGSVMKTLKARKAEGRQRAHKVGGIWVDPMCFPYVGR
jgi:hypothetical protein